MNRRDLLLAVLAGAQGSFSPVQIQKAVFLITRNAPNLVTDGPNYQFSPYDYGPFDQDVYLEANVLRDAGEAVVAPSPYGRWLTYEASDQGRLRGTQILNGLPVQMRDYIIAVSGWVRSQSFGGLVKSIYEQYPDMRVNSIFQG